MLATGIMSSPSRNASLLSDDLRAMLTSNEVPKEVQDQLAIQGFFTVKAFANSVDAATEVVGFVDTCTLADGDKRSALALLKQAWKEAEATVARGIKRLSEGLSETILEEALPDTTRLLIQEAFTRRYSFNLEFKIRPSDALLGRIRREFEKGTPSMYPLVKVKSYFQQSRLQEPKRHRIAENVSWVVDNDAEEATPTVKFRHLMLQMEILVNGWGMAGCFIPKLDSAGSAATPNAKMMCEWPQAIKYARELRDHIEPILDRCTESSVCTYFIAVEEDFRQRALDHMRISPEAMFGEALLWSVDKYNSVYYAHTSMLFTRSSSASSSAGPSAPQMASLIAGAEKISATKERGKVVTANQTEKGIILCKRYNDRRGCPSPCAGGKGHACDIMLANGRVCQQLHSRFAHDDAKHGKPQYRS